MARFVVHSIENPARDGQFVYDGSFTPVRREIEAGCFHHVICTVLRGDGGVRFIPEHSRNTRTTRVYHNGAYYFMVEKVAD